MSAATVDFYKTDSSLYESNLKIISILRVAWIRWLPAPSSIFIFSLLEGNINRVKVTACWGITAGYPGYVDSKTKQRIYEIIALFTQLREV